ncbi:MAG TPA: hypothetical protein VG712_05380, partial [Gemmatimonadales bacterium]|nr:hypothetical protein [Gemmatimonadales bacterium]
MGVTTHDIFGSAEGEPATPGSYGQPPKGHRLPDDLTLGGVRLQVSDLSRSVDYYQSVLGLVTIDRSAGAASLAPHNTTAPLVTL